MGRAFDNAEYAIDAKNYIINGAMMVSQQNGTTAGTATAYWAADQFAAAFSHGGTLSFQQVTSPTPGGSTNRIRLTVTAADAAVAAGDFLRIFQPLEGLRIADLRSGSSAAKTVVVRFGVKAPAGTYCVSLRNGTPNRSYIAEFVISAGEANTDTVKSVTIPLDTGGTWAVDNTVGFYLAWNLMGGSSIQGTANTWLASDSNVSSSQFNFMGTAPGSIFELFDVGLYAVGAVPPSFIVPNYDEELLKCMRYFYNGVPPLRGVLATTSNASRLGARHPVTMRAIPTVTITANLPLYDGSGTTTSTGGPASSNTTTTTLELDLTTAAALTAGRAVMTYQNAGGNVNVDARL